MELRALRIFDTKEQVQEVMPKVFEVMTQVSGLKNDQMFILIAPMDPFYIGLEGKVFPWINVKNQNKMGIFVMNLVDFQMDNLVIHYLFTLQ